jgi:hypothetical protein
MRLMVSNVLLLLGQRTPLLVHGTNHGIEGGSTDHAKGNQQQKLHNIMFVNLPRSLLGREVKKVGLYKPYYDKNFDNWLPKYMDVVVVLFSLPLANSDDRDIDDPIETLTSNVPLWVDQVSDLDQGTSLPFEHEGRRSWHKNRRSWHEGWRSWCEDGSNLIGCELDGRYVPSFHSCCWAVKSYTRDRKKFQLGRT